MHIYVYCSSAWTAQLDCEQDWIRILPGTEKGEGIGLVRLEVDYNDVEVRDVNLILKSGEYSQTVHISQKYDSTHWVIK
jgi:Iap family predicted aminopeptidase